MDEVSLKIGAWLKETRRRNGLTLPQLAYLAGLSHGQFSRIENGLSAVTLFTLVRIFHAYTFTFTAIYGELDLPQLNPPAWKDEVVIGGLDEYPALRIGDIEDFIDLHMKNPSSALQLLMRLVDLTPAASVYKRNGSMSQNQSLLDLFRLYIDRDYAEYPPVTLQTYQKIYLSGGVLMLADLGRFIKDCRLAQGKSLRQLAKEVGITHRSLINFEKAISEKLKFVDLIKLDQALSLKGELIAVAWRVAELYTGVLRIKSQMQQGSAPPLAWTDEQIHLIERLLLITRLYQHYLPEEREWLKDFLSISAG
jgi:transcriptional regulator with XRE-family HTH domain